MAGEYILVFEISPGLRLGLQRAHRIKLPLLKLWMRVSRFISTTEPLFKGDSKELLPT